MNQSVEFDDILTAESVMSSKSKAIDSDMVHATGAVHHSLKSITTLHVRYSNLLP
jgi:hypothetical protein